MELVVGVIIEIVVLEKCDDWIFGWDVEVGFRVESLEVLGCGVVVECDVRILDLDVEVGLMVVGLKVLDGRVRVGWDVWVLDL